MVFKNICILVHWTKVASALEGLSICLPCLTSGQGLDVACAKRMREVCHAAMIDSHVSPLRKPLSILGLGMFTHDVWAAHYTRLSLMMNC